MNTLFKKTITQHIINVIVFAVCMGILLLGLTSIMVIDTVQTKLPQVIEQSWRIQARRTLNDLRVRFEEDMKNGTVNIEDENSIHEWCKKNMANVLNGGPTGDGFVINLGTEKFLWDGSPDCAKAEFITNGRYLKDEPGLHKNPKQAEKIVDIMKLGQDTTESDNYWWQFDDSKEYMEWIVIPPGKLGFNDESYTVGGVKNKHFSKILIELGTQQDEVEEAYKPIFNQLTYIKPYIYALVTICYIVCIFSLSLYVFFSKRNSAKAQS